MIMSKRYLLYIIATVLFFAADSEECRGQNLNLNDYNTDTFTKLTTVTGQILGSGYYHTGAIHRFGGFDVSIKSMIGIISDEYKNGPLDDTELIPLPAIQANVGLFDRFEIGGRLFSFKFGDKNKENINLTSGILKYKLLSGIGLPDIMSYAAFSRISGITDFSLKTVTLGAVIGYGVPFISVYAGVNYNIILMDVNLAPDNNLYPTGFNEEYTEKVGHFTAGTSLSIAPFTKINAEINIGKIKTATAGLVFSLF